MTWHVGVSGTYKTVASPSVGVGGVWKAVTSAWVGVGGVWKQFYAAISVALSGQYVPGNSSASYRLKSDGIAQRGINAGFVPIVGEWLVAGAAGDCEARASGLAGDTGFVTGTFNAWLNLGTTRTWELTAGAGQFHSCSFTVEIRRASDAVVVATAVILMDANNA